MDDTQLLDILSGLGHPRVVVLGDLILDAYTWGYTSRVSQEAPVLVLRAEHQEFRLGGAANVAHMVAALGAEVVAAGVVGNDPWGHQVRQLMADAQIDTRTVLTDPSRPTSFKERFLGRAGSSHANQMLRVDREVCDNLSDQLQRQLQRQLEELLQGCDAVLVADYAKGVCTRELMRWLLEHATAANCPVLVDPGPGRNLELYRGATLIKPNRRETEAATGTSIPNAAAALMAGQRLCDQYDLKMACITLDSDGMVLSESNGQGVSYPTQARDVYDITGAGDMVMAMLGHCMAQRLPMDVAVRLANIAAGLEVERNGVVPIRVDEIRHKLESTILANPPKIVDADRLSHLANGYRQQGRRIVFTNGCFDLLHVGHVTYLQEAASLGDVLIVGVNGDQSVRRLKGPQRPVIHETDRAAMLAALQCVDHVVVFNEDTPHALLAAIRPDVLVKGGTYQLNEVVGHEFVHSYGGKVAVTGVIDGVSTTRIIESVQQQHNLRRAG